MTTQGELNVEGGGKRVGVGSWMAFWGLCDRFVLFVLIFFSYVVLLPSGNYHLQLKKWLKS